MALNGDSREINTGNLEVDGSALDVTVERRSSTAPNRQWHEVVASNGNGYSNNRVVAPLGMLSRKGIVAREITRAIDQGYKVTSQSDRQGEIEFRKLGPLPFAVGYARYERPQSLGRFGLGGLLESRQ